MKYLLVESLRRGAQLLVENKFWNFPLLLSLRTVVLRLFFKIGKGTLFADHVSIESHHKRLGILTIGNHVEVSPGVILDITGGLTIGDHVWISEGAIVLTHDHDIAHGLPKKDWPIVATEKNIEQDAWVGARAVILPGAARIGRRAIVAAGSVVTRSVDDYAIVAGNPAKVIGSTAAEPAPATA